MCNKPDGSNPSDCREMTNGCQIPSSLDEPHPSGDSVGPPLKFAGYSGCRGKSEVRGEPAEDETGIEGVKVPGISFTVIFSGYNVFKQLSPRHPDDSVNQKTKTARRKNPWLTTRCVCL